MMMNASFVGPYQKEKDRERVSEFAANQAPPPSIPVCQAATIQAQAQGSSRMMSSIECGWSDLIDTY